jgi:hypothetical protein
MGDFIEIAVGEYEQRRHARDLAAWVNARFSDLETGAVSSNSTLSAKAEM